MAFDIIVFSQEELERAIISGNTRIGLCDNTFVLPNVCNIFYTAIGAVSVSANVTKDEFDRMNIICCGFEPHLAQNKTPVPPATIQPPASFTASASSYLSSYFMSSYFMSSYLMTSYFTTSYFMTSYTTSYMYKYEYEYEYETGSFASSYSTSFRSSISSFLSSFLTSFRAGADGAETGNVCIMVNGYGINLI